MASVPTLCGRLNDLKLEKPGPGKKVYNEQCVMSFDTPFSEEGIFINLKSFQAFGRQWVEVDHQRTSNAFYLNIKFSRVKIEKIEEPEVTKLAFGVDGGFGLDGEYRTEKRYTIVELPSWEQAPFPAENMSTENMDAMQGIIDHAAPNMANDIVAWEEDIFDSPNAKDLVQVNNGVKIPPNSDDWVCSYSGAKENLWLNLSTGVIGDGRKNWDGTGGNNGALMHYEEEKKKGNNFPLVVKLGTITPDGGDCYDYAINDSCKNPNLAEHLAHFGIDIMKQTKTEKTTTELNIDLNKHFGVGFILSGGDAEKVSGPGLIGLDNLGNSCYMNSVLQTFVSLPEVQDKYLKNWELLASTSDPTKDLAEDFPLQMAKLCTGLLTDQYATMPEGKDTASISPQMARALIAKGNAEFMTKRQQDAQEYVLHLFSTLEKEENKAHGRLPKSQTIQEYFQFKMEERFQCNSSGKVRISDSDYKMLQLQIDVNKASNIADIEEQRNAKRMKLTESDEAEDVEKETKQNENEEKKIIPIIPFDYCIDDYLASEELPDWHSPITNAKTGATKSLRLSTFPHYLMIQMQRYYVDENWMPKKLEVRVDLPQNLDLSRCAASGLQDGEVELPNDSVSTFEPNPDIVTAVVNMGFSENAGKRAAKAVNNEGVELAVNWVCSNMDDPNLNAPLEEEGSGNDGADPEKVGTLGAYGIPAEQAAFVLKKTNGNLEAAVNYYFENQGNLEILMIEAATEASNTSDPSFTNGNPQYTLKAIISHLGNQTASGHYVAHVLKDGQWYFFNDSKVEKVTEPPYGFGYLYLYERANIEERAEN